LEIDRACLAFDLDLNKKNYMSGEGEIYIKILNFPAEISKKSITTSVPRPQKLRNKLEKKIFFKFFKSDASSRIKKISNKIFTIESKFVRTSEFVGKSFFFQKFFEYNLKFYNFFFKLLCTLEMVLPGTIPDSIKINL
jgi:hypothetical protein